MSEKKKPNLFIIGAMKSGTSSLHSYLGAHSQIYMSSHKEPMFFSRPEGTDYSLQEYEDLFSVAGDVLFTGESSTEYSKLPQRQNVVNRLKNYAPDAKLIYIMRDPFKRSVSHYWHQVKAGREKRSMLDAITNGSEYMAISHYSYQLAPYIEKFGRENIFLCAFESLVDEPKNVLQQIFEWLNLDIIDLSAFDTNSKKNVTPEVLYFGGDWYTKLINSLPMRKFKKLLPSFYSFILNLLPIFSSKFVNIKSQSVEIEVEQLFKKLLPTFNLWNSELEELTKCKFPEWKTWP